MNSEEFIDAIKLVVRKGSIESVKSALIEPPGRSPSKKDMLLSDWFNSNTNENRDMILKVIEESVDSAIFGFLCVLDGVAAIEGIGEKGKLELYFTKGTELTQLNDPEGEYLHDIFKWE